MGALARIHQSVIEADRAKAFVQLAMALARNKGSPLQARHECEEGGWCGSETLAVLKSASTAMQLGSSDAAHALAGFDNLVTGFVGSLRNFGAFDRMLSDNSFARAPLRTRIALTTIGAVGSVPGEGELKTISRLTVANDALDTIKATCNVIVSLELLRTMGPVATELIGTELKNAVAVATDTRFIADMIFGAGTQASAGTTAANTLTDVAYLFNTVVTGSNAKLYFVCPSTVAKKLATRASTAGEVAFPGLSPMGGTLFNVPVIASDGAPSGNLILLDASQVVAASDIVTLDASSQTSVQMDSAPDSPPTASTILVSLWQNNLAALRCERWFGCQRMRTTACAVITGVA